MNTFRRLAVVALAVFAVATGMQAAAFTPGNIVVYRVGDGVAALGANGTAVFLDEYTPSGTFVQSIAMPNTGTSGRLVAAGNATTEGFMTLSADSHYLIVPGYDALVGATTPPTSTTIPRVIGRVDPSGTLDATTSYVDAATPGNIRSATSNDGTRFWASGSTQGVRTVLLGGSGAATIVSNTATNMRNIAVFTGQLYIGSGAGTIRMATVGSGLPTTSGQTMTNLPGLPTATATVNGFFFADLSAGVPGVDTLYLCDETAGQVQKWTLSGGTWAQTGSVTLATARGLAGVVNGSNVTLFATSGGAGTPVVTLTDSTGYNGTLSGSATTIVASAGTNKAFRGVALVPVNPPPTVSSINRVNATPTNASSVDYTVTFSQSVTGVDSGDFTVAMSGVTGASVTNVTGSGTTYTVTVGTGSGDGTIHLDLVDNDSIINGTSVPLGGSGAGNGNFTGQTYTIDKTAPTVSSSVRASTNPTNAASVNYTVTFSEPVTGVDTLDFGVSGTVSGASVSNVSGTGATYTVTVNTGSGDGTLRLDFVSNGSVTDAVGNANSASFLTGEVYTIDKSGPTVVSSTRVNADPTAQPSVAFTVTFNESVTGVDISDFSLTTTGLTGTSVTNVTGSGTTYTVTANTGSGASGTLRLDVNNGASIQDAVGNALASGFTGGQTYTIDRNAPAVSSVTRNDPNPNRNASVAYTVTFNQSVTGVDSTDFALTTTGVTGAGVSGVSGSGTTYVVNVNTGSGDGTIRLDVNNDGSIQSGTAVPLSAPFTSGEVYTIDKTAPTVSSVVRADPNPNKNATINFTVTFSEPVSGPANSDFSLTTTGVTGASVTGVSGSGATRLVQVNTGSGDGTIRLDVVTGGTIIDAAGNLLATGFTSGEIYTIDKTAPTAVSSVRADANPTSAASVNFTVTFSEAMTSVIASDFALTTTGGISGASVGGITGSGSTRTVTVNTGSGEGTIRLDVVTGATAQDLAGNLLASSFTGGEVYTVDKVAPTVASINRANASPTGAASINWTVTFSEPVTGVDAGDFALAATGVSGASISGVTGSGTTYTVTANSGTGNGTLGLNLADDDSILDVDGSRPLGGPGAGNGNFTGQVYTIDHTAPSVVSINRAAADPTTASSVTFTVTFSEAVTGVNSPDFALASSGLSGSAITNVTGSGTTYTVTASTGTGNGTLGLNLVDDDSIIDAASNPLGGPGAGNGNFTGQVYTVNRAAATHLLISQIYGGGGNSGATYKNDFIELFNPTAATVSLSGWSVQYSSAAGSTWQVTNLTGSIAPGHYYLVQEGAGAGGTTNLPAPEVSTGTIAMAAASGKVALVNQTTPLTGTCPLGVTVIDFIGYGTANCSEGGTAAATLTNTTSASRIDNGCTDTDHNNLDFTGGTVNPRNGATSPWSCGGLIGAGSASPSTVGASSSTLLTMQVTPAQSPASTGITATADLTPIGGSATQTLFDNGTNGDVTPGDNIFSFSAVVGAATSSGPKTINVALADAQARAGASTISLTILGATNPSGNGTATPASVAPTQTSLLTVAVTLGQNPPSTGITVTADLSSIGGSASQPLFDDGTNGDAAPGDGTWSYNATVANGTPLGLKSLAITILDAQARTGSTTISLTVQSATAPPAPSNLVAVGGNNQVSLSWGASAGATGYNVKRGTASGGPYATIANNVGTNSFLDTLVSNGTHYYYIVTALNATDESGPSNEADATPQAPPPAPGAKIYFIDIGQGASTLIVSPTGKTLLVDGGPTGQGTAKVVPLLTQLGIGRLDYTILTHYHIDHDDGLTETINAGHGALVAAYDNGDTTPLQPPNPGGTKTAYQNYVNALTSHSIPRVRPEDVGGTLAGTDIDLGGGMHATIMAQGGRLLSGGSVTIDNSDLNTESISTLIQYGDFDFLVSGDLTGGGSTSTAKTPDVETYVAQMTGDVDIVEYDHHGSTTANNPRFLRLLKAEAAVAECGYTNTFGHPNRETVNKYLNIPATSGNTYGGTGIPNPGNGPVSYQTDPSPATDDRVARQGYSGAAPANAGNGTILLKTDGATSFTMESFDDGAVRLNPAQHAYSLDSAGAGVATNFPPTVIPSISPLVPLASDTVTVSAMVNDREDAISSVTLNYSLNGAAQAPVPMSLSAGFYVATIPAQPDATRVDITVTAVAGGKATAAQTGYFSGTTPIANLRVLDALGEPLYLDYAARIAGTATSDTNVFSIGTNDDYIQDATGGINIWRTIQPTVPGVDSIATGSTYTVAGRIGELAGRFHLEVTPPFASVAPTPYTIMQTGSGTVSPAAKTIAQILANPESLEGQLVSIGNCTITQGTIPPSGATADAFLTVTDGTGSFQLKIDKDTSIPGMATPAGTFAIIGIIQQDDFLRPFDSGYDIAPRTRVDLGGVNSSGPALISIAAARIDVDGSGNSPGDYIPDLLNSTVHVQGVVTSINFRQSNGSGIEYYIQDPTAGVDVFSTATTRSLNIGDDVDVIATVKQFNGLTEIDPGATTSNLTVLAPGTLPAVAPRLVTCADLADNGVGEPLEGQFLRINNVTLSAPPATWAASTNYTISDASGPCTIRISASTNLPGVAPPAGTFSILGVLGQFDSAGPFDSGYQLFPRSTSDVLQAVPATASISATAGTPQSTIINSAFATQLQATVRDAGNAVISGAGVTFTAPASGASGTFAGGATSVTLISDASGVATAPVFTANSTTGTYNVTATSGPVNTTFSLTNTSQPVTHFSVSAPASVTNGVSFSVTVTALNASNSTVAGYTGTVHFTSTSNGTLPGDYTFTGGDAGVHTFTVTLTTNSSQSITVADLADGSISGTANLTVVAPPATHFSVTAPATVTAGSSFSVTVTALDASDNPTSNYTGTVHFTSTSAGTLPADYTFVTGDNGTKTFSATLTQAGPRSITATDTVSSSITGTANTTVNPGGATHYTVNAPAGVTAGTAFSVTVTALDASNNTATSYGGTAHFTSSSAGTLPVDYAFTLGDAGVHTFSVTLTTPGAQSVTATDTVTASITGTANTTVGAGAATHFSINAPANVTAGSAFTITVTALDSSNNTAVGYTGTAHFTSSSAGTLPADYTFTGGDAGVHTFSVTLTTPGAQSVTATDTVTASITGTANTTVGAGAATHFSINAPANVTAGSAFTITVTALDASNNTAVGYTGTAHFTSSSAGTLPADYTFTGGDAGVHTFNVTLTTPGAQSVTATDTVTASITGTANTNVSTAPATHYSVTAPANVTAGTPFSVTVTALDASNATVTGYTGTVHFTSSSAGTLPADYTFVSGDNGAHTFSVTLTSTGAQSVTATDTVTAITGTANTTVSAAAATHFAVTAPASVTNGTAFSVTVTALDASNATVTGYTGTVHFTSSSTGTLPANYTFTGGDAGTHAFSVTLTSNGAQTITATDTVTAITGTANTTINCPALSVTAANDGPVCPGGTVHLTAVSPNSGVTYSWTGPAGFTSNQQNPTIAAVPGTYTVTVTSGACSASNSTTVIVTSPPSGIAPSMTAPATICANSPGTASAQGGTSYAWSITNGTFTSPTNGLSVDFTAGTSGNVTLSVVITETWACGSSSTTITKSIPINKPPSANIPATLSICGPGTIVIPITLQGTAPFTITWSDGFVQTSATKSATRSLSLTSNKTLFITSVSDAGCTSNTDSKHISLEIDSAIVVSAAPQNQYVPNGTQATFTVTATGGNLHYHWYYGNPGDTSNEVGLDQPSFTTPWPVHGIDKFWLRITNACGSWDSGQFIATNSQTRRRTAPH